MRRWGKGHFTADGQRYINPNWHTNSIFSIDLTQDYALATLVPTGLDKPDDLVMTADERKGYTASHGSNLLRRRVRSTPLTPARDG
jgi:hypothetical protein